MPALLPPITANRARATIVVGRLISGTLLTLGVLGMLRTKMETTEELVVLTVHPVTAVVWLVLGLAGVVMSVDARPAQVYLAGTGALLVAWALLCLALGGSPSEVFARDPALIALHLAAGLLCLTAALVPPVGVLARVVG